MAIQRQIPALGVFYTSYTLIICSKSTLSLYRNSHSNQVTTIEQRHWQAPQCH